MGPSEHLLFPGIISIMIYATAAEISSDCVEGAQFDNISRNDWKVFFIESVAVQQPLLFTVQCLGYINSTQNAKEPINRSCGILPGTFTYNARNETIYWMTSTQDRNMVYRDYLNQDGLNDVEKLDSTLKSPVALAFDWITGNLYCADSSLDAIVACEPKNRERCGHVLSRANLSLVLNPNLVLHPNLGIMFWLGVDGEFRLKIYRAGMDGQFSRAILKPTSASNPLSSLVVDHRGGRLYWSFFGSNVIQSSNYDGKCQSEIQMDAAILSIDVLNSRIFWSAGTSLPVLMSTDKCVPKNNTILFEATEDPERKQPNLKFSFQRIFAYDKSNQPIYRENACENNTMCPHVCVLSPPHFAPGYRCLCAVDLPWLTLPDAIQCNSTTCQNSIRDSNQLANHKLIIAYENILSFSEISDTDTREHKASIIFYRRQIQEINSIRTLVYKDLNDTFILADYKRMYEYNLTTAHINVIGEHESCNVSSIGVDALIGNIYWVDDHGGSIHVMSIATGKSLTLMKKLDQVCDMLVLPQQRSLVLAVKLTSGGIVIRNLNLDGSIEKARFHDASTKDCITLFYEAESKSIMWSTKTNSEKIEVIELLPSGQMVKANPVNLPNNQPHFPNNIARQGNTIFWVDSEKICLNMIKEESHRSTFATYQILADGEFCRAKYQSPTFKVTMLLLTPLPLRTKAFNVLRDNHDCHLKNCSHLCFSLGEESVGICRCSTGYHLEQDGKSCTPNGTTEAFYYAKKEWILIACGGAGVLIITLFLSLIVFRWYRHRTMRLSDSEIEELFCGGVDIPEYDKLKWELPRDAFAIDTQILGSGEFGVVLKGKVKRIRIDNTDEPDILVEEVEVAVKTCKEETANANSLRSLVAEMKMMAGLGKHENIVSLLGGFTAEIQQGVFYMFVEYCELVSLLKYLREAQPNPENSEIVKLAELCQFTKEIANGMEFLTEKKVVHADLAARNVLLTSDKTAKISDFGLSRKLYNYSQYVKRNQEPLPWRWMAPESITRMEFDEKTDVWAFGVTMWEIFSKGNTPYPGVSWDDQFVNRLEQGLRMEQPKHCPEEVHSAMMNCWSISPSERPDFAELSKMFRAFTGSEYLQNI